MYDPYCPQCRETTDLFFFCSLTEAVCTYCGGPVRTCSKCGALHSEDWHRHNGKRFCHKCYLAGSEQRAVKALNEAQTCRWCRRKGQVDYRAYCEECAVQEVFDPGRAADLVVEILDMLAEELNLLIPASYSVQLGGVKEMDPEHLYFHDKSALGGWIRGTRKMVFQPRLPRWLLSAVVAHQHTHAWQASECHEQSPVLIESLARWTELKTLEALDCADHFEALHLHQGLQYEQGLDFLLDLEEISQPKGVIAEVTRMRDFPLWVYEPRRA